VTREERTYFYNQLYKLFHNWVEENKGDDLFIKSIALNSFANRYMQTITGQQPLPQAVFRAYLEECLPVLDNVQEKYDSSLNTVDKSIAGAINEVNRKIGIIKVDNEVINAGDKTIVSAVNRQNAEIQQVGAAVTTIDSSVKEVKQSIEDILPLVYAAL
jgi:methyl-accepting chemotaxis protein